MALQAEKSAAMRQKILDAAIAVLVQRGYKATTTLAIARRARVSRGGMLHHFASREELVVQAVEHLFERRLEEMGRRLAGDNVGGTLTEAADSLLAIYTGETFWAWLELLVAARTDPKLHKHLVGLDQRFVAAAEAICHRYVVERGTVHEVKSATRLILAIFDGLAMHSILVGGDREASETIRFAARFGVFGGKRGR